MSDPTFFDPHVVSHEANYTLETNCGDPRITVLSVQPTNTVNVLHTSYHPPGQPNGLAWTSLFTPILDASIEVQCDNRITYRLTKRFTAPASIYDGTAGYMFHFASGAVRPPTIYPGVEQSASLLEGNILYAYSKARSPVGGAYGVYRPYERTTTMPVAEWEDALNGLDFGVLPARDASLQGRLDRPVLLVHGRGRDYRDWGVTIPNDAANPSLRSMAFRNGWVKDYQDGSLPDMLARGRGLNTCFDPLDPSAGINRNGIYFHNAKPSLRSAPPAVTAQYWDLSVALERALTDHFGASWSTDPTKQIDIVCHSQGCLIVRDLLRRAPTSGPMGSANPSSHIRKIVSVNSPHFGSALVTSAGNFSSAEQASKYADATSTFRDLILNSHRIAHGKLNMGAVDYADQADNALYKSFCEGDETTYQACMGFYSWRWAPWVYNLLGSFFGGIDVNFSLDGPLLGPWVWEVRTQGQSAMSGTIQGNPATQNQIMDGLRSETDLGQSAGFVRTLVQTGFPARPDGSLVEFQALYSGSTRDLTAQLASQISHDMIGFCEESVLTGTQSQKNLGACLSIAGEIEKYASKLANQRSSGSRVEDVKVSDGLQSGMQKLRDVWLSNSDLLVEKESQNPYGRPGFDPDASGAPDQLRSALPPPRDFRIRRGLARGSRDTLVVHGPFQIPDNPVGTGPLMRQRGAPRMGLDLYCALDQVCDLYLAKANTSFPTGHPVASSDPSGSSLIASRGAGSIPDHRRGYTFEGNFDLAVLDAEANLTSLRIGNLAQATREGDDLLIRAAGQETRRFSVLGSTSLWVRRSKDVLELGFRRDDGAGWSKEYTATSPSIELVVSWSGQRSAPLLAGSGREIDTLPIAATHGALVFHREAANSWQESRPQGMIFNGTNDTIHGIELAYHFSADPARNPQVILEHAPDASLRVEHLGGEDWRFVIRSPSFLAPGKRWPFDGPWSVRMSYGDGSAWNLLDDPSRYHNLGAAAENPWIPWRDANGTLICGEDPPRTIRTALDSTTRLEVFSRADQDSTPWVQPKVRIKNHGSRSVGKIRMGILLAIPPGRNPSLQDWSTPEASLRLLPRRDGLWMLEALFDQHRIAAGSAVDLGDWGVHLEDWSAWSGPVSTTEWQSDSTIALWDSAGVLLWGHWSEDGDPIVSPPTPILGTMRVEMRDESPNDLFTVRPRVRLTRSGSGTLSGIRIRGVFTSPPGRTAQLNPWFPPGCSGEVDGSTAVITCPSATLSPGVAWPDQSGLVFGLHHTDWAVWDRSDDPSFAGLTAEFQDWTRLRVEAIDGTCLAGCTP